MLQVQQLALAQARIEARARASRPSVVRRVRGAAAVRLAARRVERARRAH